MVEPRWDRDLAYGRQGELLIGGYLEWIARGNGRVEVKRKRRLDAFFYVETACDKGRTGVYEPSGIKVTEADVWAFVIADTGLTLLVPIDLLRASCSHTSAQQVEERDGSCPTKGYLVSFAAMLATANSKEER